MNRVIAQLMAIAMPDGYTPHNRYLLSFLYLAAIYTKSGLPHGNPDLGIHQYSLGSRMVPSVK